MDHMPALRRVVARLVIHPNTKRGAKDYRQVADASQAKRQTPSSPFGGFFTPTNRETMAYKIITQPTVEPVTLAEAKIQCRADGNELDSLLTGVIIPAARRSAEHETGRALCTQTRELVLDAFPADFELYGSPIQSVVSVKYLDESGNEQTLDRRITSSTKTQSRAM
jgi:hypothetical protein